MEAAPAWKSVFEFWPADVPRSGVLVTSFAEQIPFEGFLYSDSFLLLERRTPDTVGARKVIVPYQQIIALKLVDVVKSKVFEQLGFSGSAKK